MAPKVLAVLALLAVSSAENAQSRWSRQISSYTSDISDWVPLSGPFERELPQIRRQAVAEPRILSEPFPGFVKPAGFSQDTFPSRAFYNSPSNRQLYLQSVPSAPQNYISEQGFNQGLRFGLAQSNFPLSQGFVSPQFSFDNVPQVKPRPQHLSNQIKFENPPLKSNPPQASPVKPFTSQASKPNYETPKFVDGYRAENNSDLIFTKKPQSLQKIKFEHADKSKETFGAPKAKVEREEVQLLYVPLESLNRGQFNFRSPLTSPHLLNNELYNERQNPLMQNLAAELQSPIAQPMDAFNSQEFITNFNGGFREVNQNPQFSTVTTPFPTTAATTTVKPKKLKPHQPPLAIFSTQDEKIGGQIKVGDILQSLKNANTVAVLDSVNPLNAPKVFIGPSSLSPPENYVKFELPYLSNIENIDKKLRQLPFFVAPLSYNTPQGFAKIPFPSPHVGSVVINSLIKDTTSASKPLVTDINSNLYSRPTQYKQEQKPITQKPVINYYTTSSPKVNSPNYEQNFFSIEPQSVSTLRPLKNTESNLPINQETPPPYKTSSYFLGNLGNQYNPSQFVNFPQETNYKTLAPTKIQNVFKPETTTTPRITVTTSTKSSTYPNQLLETHNPYSINQAFHYSTPLDYQNFFDEYKEAHGNSGPFSPPAISISSTIAPTKKEVEPEQPKVEQQPQPVTPNYLQNYTPEIHHESEILNSRYPVFNTNDYFTKTTLNTQNDYTNSGNPIESSERTKTVTNTNESEEYTSNLQTQTNIISENNTLENILPETSADVNQVTKPSSEYNQYESGYNSQEIVSSTTASTTTTRSSPIRTRGRPRYPSVKTESQEYSTRAPITRKPLRERKPLPPRSRYEPNKITTESQTRKPIDSSESTTKSTRTRTRGRVHYRVPEADNNYTKKNKPSKKENDLAYQRDVLHQNYPVTLMERTSTVDIEAITEPNVISSNIHENVRTDDTEDAYSNDKVSITAPINSELEDLPQHYTTAIHSITDASYVQKVLNHDEDYTYPQKSSVDSQNTGELIEESYSVQTSPVEKPENQDNVLYATKSSITETETNIPVYSNVDEFQTNRQEEVTHAPELGNKVVSQDLTQEREENIVETTPSYNRVRVRPGVIRQYHQASSTESTRIDRKKPVQPITYRPAFDRRRTTMRIEEIEADLKTKQVHVRPEFQDYKQPIYKPEPPTESSAPSSTTETSTRRGPIRRRRPSYATTSTETTITRKPYEAKIRFRGRRPTEKPTDKPELQSDTSSTTVKNNVFSRYSHRPRLSERYNKKPETEDQVAEDQDLNYSINRPKYAAPESERWSPKISTDSFKPYNPNTIAEEAKVASPSNGKSNDELDIITARNENEDILISVTPAYNNRVNKKLSDIPPTLEALVEQSKVTKSESTDTMSTFESMLEEVMKSLEEQDENEYTSNVMKHKGGEIGEIPPERIISSGENYSLKSTTPIHEEATTPIADNVPPATVTEVPGQKNRRRGFWKKVKVRPVTEGIDAAESQYYPHVVNRLGQHVPKNSLEKSGKGNSKVTVTTYKPNYQFLKDFFETHDNALDAITNIDIPKITTISNVEMSTEVLKANSESTTKNDVVTTTEKDNPGDMDLGTGSPDPTYDDSAYYSEPTEPTAKGASTIDRSDGLSFMDYLFGVTAPDNSDSIKNGTTTPENTIKTTTDLPKDNTVAVDSEETKVKITTESSYVPEEMTAETIYDSTEGITESLELNKINKDGTHKSVVKVESSSVSSFMDPTNVISTSMSTEVSHETEICFRGKCIKTNKNLL